MVSILIGDVIPTCLHILFVHILSTQKAKFERFRESFNTIIRKLTIIVQIPTLRFFFIVKTYCGKMMQQTVASLLTGCWSEQTAYKVKIYSAPREKGAGCTLKIAYSVFKVRS